MNISGHGVKIRALSQDDLDLWTIDLDGHDASGCVAVDGQDLGSCLAAVVWIGDDETDPLLIWSDADGKGTPIAAAQDFADAVRTVVASVIRLDLAEVA